MKEQIIIVDEQDQVIGHKERGTLKSEDIYRVSALWIMNSKGEVLLAQRSFSKRNDPGKWGPAVAGTNGLGETYESNMVKEIEEEIGIQIKKPKKLFKRRNTGKHNYFVQWFFEIVDKGLNKFTLQKEEVEQIKWFSKEEYLTLIKDPKSNILDSMRTNKEIIQLVEDFK